MLMQFTPLRRPLLSTASCQDQASVCTKFGISGTCCSGKVPLRFATLFAQDSTFVQRSRIDTSVSHSRIRRGVMRRPISCSELGSARSVADDTRADASNLVVYEVFIRNHTPQGTLKEAQKDLQRIKALGVDCVWLMPHYPIGEDARKGTAGSPYCIRDYRSVNTELGSDEDFDAFVTEAKQLGLRAMIDIVFNHTSRDSILALAHPEWFKRDEYGNPTSPWSDVADLSFKDRALWDYLYETLEYWARRGVNGFRCDVASFVPLPFWLEARRRVAEINPDVLWLAESTGPAFLTMRRDKGELGLCDAELFQAFDAVYDYDFWFRWCALVAGDATLPSYLEMLRFQDAYLPTGAVKVRFVENHDHRRIMERAPSQSVALAWTAFAAVNKGALLLYAGQEAGARKPPELFEKDPIDWSDRSLEPFIRQIVALKKHPALRHGRLTIAEGKDAIIALWQQPDGQQEGQNLLGVFNVLDQKEGLLGSIPLPDGDYVDVLQGLGREPKQGGCRGMVRVKDRTIEAKDVGAAVVLSFQTSLGGEPLRTTLLDHISGRAVF